ncbi:MAG TPA: hypothetical protein VNK41_02720 [Vicinamibacterales bacterium]|nr:hypothetical protein [Vicinamibacterales bacterium]
MNCVRHVERPEWGHGVVIGGKKGIADVFFIWGGRREVERDAGVLEPIRATPLEMELFALCTRLSKRTWTIAHHSIYAIELDPAVMKVRDFRERNPGGAPVGCLYVGITGLDPEERFERHRRGTQSGRFVRRHGLRLRMDLVEGFTRLPYKVAAWMEPRLAAKLRARGYGVWQH